MKRLILIRHAKSSWQNLDLRDHDRPLTPKGQKGCSKIAQWLSKQAFHPQEVHSSTAERCVETWTRIEADLKTQANVQFHSSLYHSTSDLMKSHLAQAQAQTVALIAHNPGIGDLAYRLAANPSQHTRFQDYPTAATTVIDFEIENWRDLSFGIGHLVDFVIPADL